jgi:hypothetical protein
MLRYHLHSIDLLNKRGTSVAFNGTPHLRHQLVGQACHSGFLLNVFNSVIEFDDSQIDTMGGWFKTGIVIVIIIIIVIVIG